MENEVNNTVSLEMDRDAAAAESQSESSTLSNSLDSGLTVESSRGGDADSKKLDECDGWTNEKHNLYLDSLENSFVKQLYSLLVGGGTQTLSTTRGVQSNSHKLTHQFTVLQNGYRHKVSFGKKRAHLETVDKGFTRTSMKNSLVHQYPAQSTAEESGQNFREEERGCDSEASVKRRRGANFDDSSLNDQVVP